MTSAEARAVLGIDGPTDAKQARRAYLRAVKRHKPERDPDGFQRVRHAYEVVQSALRRTGRLPALPTYVAPVADADPVGPVVADPKPVVEPDPPAAQEEQPVVVADAALFVEPVPVDLASWTVTPMAPEPETVRVERVVAERPPPGALLAMAADAAEIEADHAVALVLEALQPSDLWPDPSVLEAITPVLLLHRAGHATHGSEAWSAVSAWVAGLGLGTQLHQGIAARLLLTREISELPSDFPSDLRRRMAMAILDNDLLAAQPDVYDFAQVQQLRARAAADQLAANAPNLSAIYHDILRPPRRGAPRTPHAARPGRRFWVPWALVVLFVLGVALCGRGTNDRPTGGVAWQASSLVADSELCMVIDVPCPEIVGLSALADMGSCDVVARDLPAIAAKTAASGHPLAARRFDVWRDQLARTCPSLSGVSP